MRIYVASVGRNANLLINIPVDTRGLIHPNDSSALMGLQRLMTKGLASKLLSTDLISSSTAEKGHLVGSILDKNVKSFWAAKESDLKPQLKWSSNESRLLNAIVLQEPIALGQRVKSFEVSLTDETGSVEKLKGYTIGNKRILPFKARKLKSIQVDFLDARGQVLIANFDLLYITSERNESLYH
jgi:alpha-L-fucosidase